MASDTAGPSNGKCFMDAPMLRSLHALELRAFRAREATAHLLVAINGCPDDIALVWEACVARMVAALDDAGAAHRDAVAARDLTATPTPSRPVPS